MPTLDTPKLEVVQNVILRAVDLKDGTSVPYVPTPSQTAFHVSDARYRAFIAGTGNGKTSSCCAETLFAALAYPGSFNAVVRWDQTSLKDTTWRTLLEMIKVSGLNCLVKRDINNDQKSLLEFTNGSTIQGFHAKSWERFGGLGLSSFFMDEVSELQDDRTFQALCDRVERHAVGPNRGWICGLANGQNWYWKRFFASKLPDHALFRGSTFDNPYQKDGYAERMVARYGPERAAVLVMGSFDSVEGRLFEMFDYETHVLPRTALPASWPRYAGVDPGRVEDPAAMLRVVVDIHGNIIIETEYARKGRVTEQWAPEMLSLNQTNPPEWYVLDKTAFSNTHTSAVSVEATARQAGMYPIRKAANNPGYLDQAVPIIRNMLTPMPGRIHPITGQEGVYPRLYIFEDLQLTIREFKNFRMLKSGAASAAQGIRVPDHEHDLLDCFLFISLEQLHPAEPDAAPPLSKFWQEVLALDQPSSSTRTHLSRISRR